MFIITREQLMLFYPWRNEWPRSLSGPLKHCKQNKNTKKEYDANTDYLDEVEAAAKTQKADVFGILSSNIESVEAKNGKQDPLLLTK